MLITTILRFVRYIQSFAILSILAYLVMLNLSSFLAIPHSTSHFSVYAVETYPFPVDNHSVYAADTQFFLVDYHLSRQIARLAARGI